MSVQAYFAAKDNSVPRGVKKGVQRRTYVRTRGPWTVNVTSSCGYEKPHLSGSLKISLSHVNMAADEKPVVKRLSVDNWVEAQAEITALWDMLSSPVNRGLTLEDIRS